MLLIRNVALRLFRLTGAAVWRCLRRRLSIAWVGSPGGHADCKSAIRQVTKLRYAVSENVTQIFDLPYRRFVTGERFAEARRTQKKGQKQKRPPLHFWGGGRSEVQRG